MQEDVKKNSLLTDNLIQKDFYGYFSFPGFAASIYSAKKNFNQTFLGEPQKNIYSGLSTKRVGGVRGCPLRKNNFFLNIFF